MNGSAHRECMHSSHNVTSAFYIVATVFITRHTLSALDTVKTKDSLQNWLQTLHCIRVLEFYLPCDIHPFLCKPKIAIVHSLFWSGSVNLPGSYCKDLVIVLYISSVLYLLRNGRPIDFLFWLIFSQDGPRQVEGVNYQKQTTVRCPRCYLFQITA